MERKDITQTWPVRAVTYFANLILLNLLFLVTSLPILTIGPAASALFTMARAMEEGETEVVPGYFRALRQQLRQAGLSWLVLLGILLLLGAEWAALAQCVLPVPSLLYVCLLVPTLVWFCYTPWVLIQPSYFYCTQRQQLHNALLFMIRLLPQTVLLAALSLVPPVLLALRLDLFLRAWPLWLLLYYAAAAGTAVKLLKLPMTQLQKDLKTAK